jgi:phosphoribosylformimino-5-aminoimidazole carboxamide ribotide isomerase
LIAAEIASIVVGLESIGGPDELPQIVQRAGVERTVFSLDMKAGRPLGRTESWHSDDPWTIAERAIVALGVRRLIVLDLANVGMSAGVGTQELCNRLKQAFPDVQITTGGGVHDIDDVRMLEANGVDVVLVASALHDGRIAPDDIKRL